MDGDHSVVGAEAAVALARRIGVDEPAVATLDWLVRHHLALADTATRRDLSEEATITRFGRLVGTSDRLDLLYALTVGDSRATGPAAWGPTKAALVRELFVKTDSLFELGVVGSGLDAHRRETLERHRPLLARRELAIDWSDRDDGLLECAVAAPDRTGLLSLVAGVLALFGFDIRDAAGYIADGMALEVFDGADRFGRLADPEGRDVVLVALRGALTVGDSRATGPAAWGPAKAALVHELFVKTDSLFELGVVGPGLEAHRRETLERHRPLLERRELAIDWSERDDGLLECAVAAPDRTGLLSLVAGVLALFGFDIRDAAGYIDDGMALEVFDGADRFGRLADPEGRDAVVVALRGALTGELPLDEQLRARIRRYRIPDPGDVAIIVDEDASPSATVVEVHAPDHVGLLAQVASTFADLGVDVRTAKVSTLGERVVDVFYVYDAAGNKITKQLTLDQLRATLLARLTSEYWLPEPT